MYCQKYIYVIKFTLSARKRARIGMEISKHLVDLVTNSIEALAKHVLIMIVADEGGQGVSVEVSDDGVGIKEEEVAKALAGEKAPRGNGLRLLAEAADRVDHLAGENGGTSISAHFAAVDLGRVGDALIVFWQEMTAIMTVTLSLHSPKGAYCFDSRLIAEKYGDPADIRTMVKVREDVNYATANLFGGNKE